MLREYRADLHIHTCLSPCADLEMSPKAIIKKAKEQELDIIAITDHNSADHVLITEEIGREEGILVVGGMEVTSQEEVHLLALFEVPENALTFQGYIYGHLPDMENREEVFGYQPIVNKDDEILGFNKRLLIGATDVSLKLVSKKVHELQGIIIASHIDREAFSLIGQLGDIPPDVPFDAMEISPHTTVKEICERLPSIKGFPLITASDAHLLEKIGQRPTVLLMQQANFLELRMALKGTKGRKILS